AWAKQRADVADVVEWVRRRRSVVEEGIGFEGDEGLDVVGRRQADGIDAADLPDVLADLRRVADGDTHQLEGWVREDLGDHELPDEARAPDHDSLGAGEGLHRR